MYPIILAPLLLALSAKLVSAQSGAWGQCGGKGWTGATTCVPGYVCTATNEWYSQCIPGTAPPVTTQPVTTQPPVSTLPPSSTVVQPPSSTVVGPAPTGSQIRGVTSPVYHFYLQNNGGKPMLGPESSSGRFTINGTITLNQSNGQKLYLNADEIGAAYKPLSLGTTATTTNWGLEGDAIVTKNPRQLNYWACSTSDTKFYEIFLQGNGGGAPSGRSCTSITMHLPCLC